ncbi:helix-turn-helix domain-containing protein [Arthrobacter celericrescens]|uniref:helix-turn-helix domain-containing protein n=1 Tax=Arthrobacter celericrescens TaxID=2320851 RepID=UPI0013C42383|nr:helix-turn-helix domain-containing protein [Arthrobacter celericrescens]
MDDSRLKHFSMSERWLEIIDDLAGHTELLADRFVARVKTIPGYADGIVSDEELHSTATESLRLLNECMADGQPTKPLLALAADLGARRARQGVPGESLTAAVRLDFGIFWTLLLELCGPDDAPLLAARVELVWQIVDEYTSQVHAGYLSERIQMAQEESTFRSEFVARLFGRTGQLPDVVASVAAALGVEPGGTFSVAAAAGQAAVALRSETTKGIMSKGFFLHESDGMTFLFWQSTRLGHGGIEVPLPRPGIADVACGLVSDVQGLSNVVPASHTAAALARLVIREDTSPLTVSRCWTRLARDMMREAGLDLRAEVNGALAKLKEPERERLEETAREYMRNGSTAETATLLYCHRNTILNRLNRFREVTGIDLLVPERAAQLVVAWL